MSLRPFTSYTSVMFNVYRNLGVHGRKCVFIAQRHHLSACSAANHLLLFNKNQCRSIDIIQACPLTPLTSRSSIADRRLLQNCIPSFISEKANLRYLYTKSPSDHCALTRALQSRNFNSTASDAHPSQNSPKEPCKQQNVPPAKRTLVQRFKDMCQDYWHVLIPIHIVTSIGWFAAFYYTATSGVDIPAFLEQLNLSETFIKPFRDSSMGYIAVAYGLYKIFTPARYAVTVGGTSLTIRALQKRGMVHPWPLHIRQRLSSWWKKRQQ